MSAFCWYINVCSSLSHTKGSCHTEGLSAKFGKIVFPWPSHDNKEANIIEEANYKLSTSLNKDSFLTQN